MSGAPLSLLALTAGLVSAAPFDLQGHRGARGLAPENTLAGMRRALAIGVSTLEMDAAVTRDGVVVLSHDPRLHPDLTRGSDGRWIEPPTPAIHALDWAQLAVYDVGRLRPGSETAERFPEQAPVDGERIPRLADALALAASEPAVRFNVETKIDPRHPELTLGPEAFAEAVIAALRDAGVIERSTLQSFDWRTLRHAARVAPALETSCLTVQSAGEDNVRVAEAGAPQHLAGLDVDDFDGSVPRLVSAAGCGAWSPHHRDVTRERVVEAHALKLRVLPWTVNDVADMERLVGLGVDGLITDYPDRLRAVLQRLGLPLPAPLPR